MSYIRKFLCIDITRLDNKNCIAQTIVYQSITCIMLYLITCKCFISDSFFRCNKLICGIANFKYQNVSQILNNDDVSVNPLDLNNINNVLMLCNCFFSFNIPSNILSERWIFCTANEIHLVNTNLLSDAKNLQVIKFFLSLKIFYLLSKITWS